MARYKVAHWLDRSWIGKMPDGSWGWVPYEQAFKFANYFKAKEAHDTLPIARDSYGFARKPSYMKVEYTEAEKNMPGNEWMRDT